MSESEEQIRALTELVQQLKAENNRLKDGGNGTVNVEAPGPSSRVVTNNVSSDSTGRVYMYAPRERKCPRFVQHTQVEQATFLCDLLDGEAKREVKFSSPTDRATPEAIFTILLDNFGCDQTYVSLQRQFFQRRQ